MVTYNLVPSCRLPVLPLVCRQGFDLRHAGPQVAAACVGSCRVPRSAHHHSPGYQKLLEVLPSSNDRFRCRDLPESSGTRTVTGSLGAGEPHEAGSRARQPRLLHGLPLPSGHHHHSPSRVDVLSPKCGGAAWDMAAMDGPGFGTTARTSMGFTAGGETRHPMTSSLQAATAGRRRRKPSLGPYPASTVYTV